VDNFFFNKNKSFSYPLVQYCNALFSKEMLTDDYDEGEERG